MKREIKFRGYDPDTKRWYYGSLVKQNKTTYVTSEDYDKNPSNTEWFILWDEMTDWCLPNRHLQGSVDPKSIGEYTGMNDKNGRSIYEGDIVKYHMVRSYGDHYDPVTLGFIGTDWDVDADIIGKVSIWPSNGVMMTNIITDDPDMFCKKYPVPKRWHVIHDCEVIGNIFDNPELLEGKR